jgi:hypothetical protein
LRKINIPPLVVFAWQGPPFAIRHDADREANHLGDAVAIVGGNKMVEISEELFDGGRPICATALILLSICQLSGLNENEWQNDRGL